MEIVRPGTGFFVTFRLGVKAGIWYRSVGLKVGWHLGSVAPGNQNVVCVGLSLRY